MKSPDKPNTIIAPRASHGPTSRRLSNEELDDLVDRFTEDTEVELREASQPFKDCDEECTKSGELAEVLE